MVDFRRPWRKWWAGRKLPTYFPLALANLLANSCWRIRIQSFQPPKSPAKFVQPDSGSCPVLRPGEDVLRRPGLKGKVKSIGISGCCE
ncbi:hypothetical protein F4808DRAFT_88288 [Astrocystis sublimbata]|nr:hypothetical protein F4808DRAFT_88288 [Astrocystis sublimbata]